MRLKDKVNRSDYHYSQGAKASNEAGRSRDENSSDQQVIDVNRVCRRYNKGRCTFGQTCRFDHRCLFCLKFGHTILNCRKL